MRHINRLLWLMLALLPALSACNNEDDVVEIFTGKTWKLSYIAAEGSNMQFNFWGDKEMNAQNTDFVNSMNLLGTKGNFTITFNGSQITSDGTGGSFTGKGVHTSFQGTWKADGKSHQLSLQVEGKLANETDVLAKNFITGITNAIRYEGDSKNLYIYYKQGQATLFLGFKPQR